MALDLSAQKLAVGDDGVALSTKFNQALTALQAGSLNRDQSDAALMALIQSAQGAIAAMQRWYQGPGAYAPPTASALFAAQYGAKTTPWSALNMLQRNTAVGAPIALSSEAQAFVVAPGKLLLVYCISTTAYVRMVTVDTSGNITVGTAVQLTTTYNQYADGFRVLSCTPTSPTLYKLDVVVNQEQNYFHEITFNVSNDGYDNLTVAASYNYAPNAFTGGANGIGYNVMATAAQFCSPNRLGALVGNNSVLSFRKAGFFSSFPTVGPGGGVLFDRTQATANYQFSSMYPNVLSTFVHDYLGTSRSIEIIPQFDIATGATRLGVAVRDWTDQGCTTRQGVLQNGMVCSSVQSLFALSSSLAMAFWTDSGGNRRMSLIGVAADGTPSFIGTYNAGNLGANAFQFMLLYSATVGYGVRQSTGDNTFGFRLMPVSYLPGASQPGVNDVSQGADILFQFGGVASGVSPSLNSLVKPFANLDLYVLFGVGGTSSAKTFILETQQAS